MDLHKLVSEFLVGDFPKVWDQVASVLEMVSKMAFSKLPRVFGQRSREIPLPLGAGIRHIGTEPQQPVILHGTV